MPELERKRLIQSAAALTELLGTSNADPAGGAVAATVAALAASLAAAAADHSRSEWEEAGGARAQAQALSRRAISLAQADIEAYADARAALAGRDDPNVVADRDLQIGKTVSLAAQVPLQIGATAADIAQLAGQIVTHGAPEIRADAAIAAVLAAGAARAAAHLVEVNLVAGIDEEIVALALQRASSAAAAAGDSTRQD